MTQPTFQAPPDPQDDGGPATATRSGDPTPPWGSAEEFDPEKAWNLIQDLRADKEKLAKRPVLDDTAKQKLAEYDKIVEAQKTEAQKAQEELQRWQDDATRWRGAAVASTVRALAATDFADPDDAVRNVDPAKYLDAGGVIDEKAIADDLAKLLEAKPHYRRAESQPSGPRAPRPNTAQGTGERGAPADPATQFAAILSGQMKQ